MSSDPTLDLPFAWGGPAGAVRLRQFPDDFRVDEIMMVPEHPGGAHWWLYLSKTQLNTKDVAHLLCEAGTARIRQVGFAGLKDKHARTRQWFSVPIETLNPDDLPAKLPEQVELLEVRRARKAIRRGGLLANRFIIRLRDFDGDRQAFSDRCGMLRRSVPNYFGPQRFGHQGNNLPRGRALLNGQMVSVPRHERGLYLSAVRSHLFNLVLAERVRLNSWNTLLPGEAVNLAGNRSCFAEGSERDRTLLAQRLDDFDIHPSGPLVGLGETACSGECLLFEQSILAREADLVQGLCGLGMKAERRALRLLPQELKYSQDADDLVLEFSLPPGCFATSVLRELVKWND